MKNNIFRTFFLSYLIYCLALGPVLADTASLLPNAVQQFFDNNGNPLTSGTVTTYQAGTSTLATTWRDSAEVTPNTNPIKLDAGGKAIIYGNQTYRQVVKDRNNNLIWDAVTAPGGGGSSPTLVGDGNLVGTILSWSGIVAPNQYVFAYGQEINRNNFSVFYTAVTQQLNVICTATSNTLTGISDTSQIRINSPIELPLCVAAGTTVVSKTASTVTLSNPSNVSINSVATFFPWGNGNGTTTFNVPDLRGIVPIGRDNMGGTSAGRITTANCGNGITPDALGAFCNSNPGGGHTNTLSELVAHNHTITDPGHNHASSIGNFLTTSGGSNANITTGSTNYGSLATTATATTGITTVITGSSVPFSVVPPSITINYIVKVTPDTSTSIATGVFSIGGMTGIISCGSGILCTGNIISSNGSPGGSQNNIQFNDNNALNGSSNFNFISPDNVTLGSAGFNFKLDIFGFTSGRVRQTVQSVAGSPTIVWGNSNGTPAVMASSPLFINSITGNTTISPDALSRVNDTNVTVTLSGSPNTSLISAVGMTLGWAGQLSIPRGGTGLASGNSGGVLFFNSATTISSSNLLTANQIMIGGGAGVAPSTFACATTTTVVHGGTPPSCGQIVAADITTNTVANSNLVQAAAATIKGNPTAALANEQDFTFGSLTQTISPGATDWIPIFDNATGTLKKVNANSIASSAVAGVGSLNGLTGALTVSPGPGITISASSITISISADIATAAQFEAGTANKLLDSATVFTTETTTTFGTTTAFDFSKFINTSVTLTNNITTMNCSNIKAGQAGTIAFIQDGTGSRTATLGTSGSCASILKFVGAINPTLTTSASAIDILSYSCRSPSYCAASLNKGFNP